METENVFDTLPNEELMEVMCKMDLPTLLNFSRTNTRAYDIVQEKWFYEACILSKLSRRKMISDSLKEIQVTNTTSNNEMSTEIQGVTKNNIHVSSKTYFRKNNSFHNPFGWATKGSLFTTVRIIGPVNLFRRNEPPQEYVDALALFAELSILEFLHNHPDVLIEKFVVRIFLIPFDPENTSKEQIINFVDTDATDLPTLTAILLSLNSTNIVQFPIGTIFS